VRITAGSREVPGRNACDRRHTYCIIIIIIIKGAEKILKYKDLTIEIQRMWNVKTKVIPVIIGATGTIPKSFRKYVSYIPGKHEVKELQKTVTIYVP